MVYADLLRALPGCEHAAAVTPSDSTLVGGNGNAQQVNGTRYLYVGGTGDVTVDTVGGETSITFKAVPVGTLLAIRAIRVHATGTTATNIVAMW